MDNVYTPFFMKDILTKAENGDADSCFDVAEYYYAQKDYSQAFQWYKKSAECDSPNPIAFFNLAYAYQYGEGTEVDMFAAFEWYQKAAAENIPQALNNLAYFYDAGIAVNRDPEKADALCRQATVLLNNLQTELYKMRKAYSKLEEQQSEADAKLTAAIEKAGASDAEARSLSRDVSQLQNELGSIRTQCSVLEQRAASAELQANAAALAEEQLKLKITELKNNCGALENQKNSQEKENQRVIQENERLNTEIKSIHEELETVSTENEQLQKDAKDNVLIIQTLQDEIEKQRTKVSKQSEAIQKFSEENDELKKRKPCIRKRTLLCWMDLFVIALIVCEYFSNRDFRNIVCRAVYHLFHYIDAVYAYILGFLAAAVFVALFIMAWISLARNKFTIYGLLHTLILSLMGFFFAIIAEELSRSIYSVYGVSEYVISTYVIIFLILIWTTSISFLPERT